VLLLPLPRDEAVTEPRVVEVSPIERAVIGELAADGATNPVIARRLGITHESVRNRLKIVMRRTGHDTRTALVVDLLRGRLKLRVVERGRRP